MIKKKKIKKQTRIITLLITVLKKEKERSLSLIADKVNKHIANYSSAFLLIFSFYIEIWVFFYSSKMITNSKMTFPLFFSVLKIQIWFSCHKKVDASYTHTHTHTHTHIYIYMRGMGVHVWLNDTDTCCLYNFIEIFSNFLTCVLISGLNG